MTVQIKLRRDTAANWVSVNPTLASGEPGLETDTLKVKYGNGIDPWVTLPYPQNNVTQAPAATLTGVTLAPNVTNSSLTSVGTLVNLTVTNTITGSISGNAGTANRATAVAGGITNQLLYQTGANTTGFISVPAVSNTFLSWSGSGFAWVSSSTVAAAGTLTGTALASNVVTSSLTSLGTLTGLTSSGAVAVNSSSGITTSSTTFPLVNTTATTVNFAGAATTLSVGATTGTTTINSTTPSTAYNNGALVVSGGVGIAGNTTIQGTLTVGTTNIKSLSIAMAAALS
jgi:hypothetical protein